jgi:hypothetical protein
LFVAVQPTLAPRIVLRIFGLTGGGLALRLPGR